VREAQPLGPYWDVVQAPDPQDERKRINLGVLYSTFELFSEASLTSYLGRYHGLVQGGLLNAVHLFQGLKRSMKDGPDMHADQKGLAYTWVPECDWIAEGGREGITPIPRPLPVDQVFAVIVVGYGSPDAQGVSGVIEDFSWVHEDSRLAAAPISHKTRFEKKLWSRRP